VGQKEGAHSTAPAGDLKSLITSINGLKDTVGHPHGTQSTTLVDIIDSAVNAIEKLETTAKGVVDGLDKTQSITLVNAMNSAIKEIKDTLTKLGSSQSMDLGPKIESAVNAMTNVKGDIVDPMVAKIDELKQTLTELSNSQASDLVPGITSAVDAMTKLKEDSINPLTTTVDAIKLAVEGLSESQSKTLVEKFKPVEEEFAKIAKSFEDFDSHRSTALGTQTEKITQSATKIEITAASLTEETKKLVSTTGALNTLKETISSSMTAKAGGLAAAVKKIDETSEKMSTSLTTETEKLVQATATLDKFNGTQSTALATQTDRLAAVATDIVSFRIAIRALGTAVKEIEVVVRVVTNGVDVEMEEHGS
jgi:vacuolar-type H+-ATPase subunit I/STV1